MLPFQQSITTGDKMAKALGIGGEERSNFILVQRPDEQGNYSSIKEIQEEKEVKYHAISPEDLLLPHTQQEPSVWMLRLTISYMYTRNCTAANPEAIGRPIVTKRDNSGKVKTRSFYFNRIVTFRDNWPSNAFWIGCRAISCIHV